MDEVLRVAFDGIRVRNERVEARGPVHRDDPEAMAISGDLRWLPRSKHLVKHAVDIGTQLRCGERHTYVR